MTAPDRAYHVKIDGKGYILLDESYAIQPQTPFNPRFSTGDPSYGDLSYWQFLNQKSFIGGQGQENFSDLTKYWQSVGWNIRNGKPSIARVPESISLANPMPPRQLSAATVSDDFTDGDYVGWTAHVGNFSAATGELVFTTATDAHRISIPQTATYKWVFKLNWNTGSAAAAHLQAHIMASTTDNTTSNGYFLDFYWSGASLECALYRSDAGVVTSIGNFGSLGSDPVSGTFTFTRSATGVFTCENTGTTIAGGTTYTTTAYLFFLIGANANNGTLSIDDVATYNSTTGLNIGQMGKVLQYNNELWMCYSSTQAAFTITELVARDPVNKIPEIRHICASDIAVISRDGNMGTAQNVFLFAVKDNVLKMYEGTTVVATINLTVYGTAILRISSTVVVVVGSTADNSGIPMFEVITFNANAVTVASQKLMTADGSISGVICNSAAVDSNGTSYFAFVDMTDSLATQPCRIFRITSTDMLATNPTISAIDIVPNFVVRGLAAIGGTVYMFGANREGFKVVDCIKQYPATEIYRSSKEIDLLTGSTAEFLNHGICTFFQEVGVFLFLSRIDATTGCYSIIETNGTYCREVAAFRTDPFAIEANSLLAIAEFTGYTFLFNSTDGAIWKTSDTVGGPASLTPTLYFSNFGANTELIEKSLYSMTLELSEALAGSETLSVYVNDILIGTMTSADGTIKEMVTTTEITGRWFSPKIVANTGCTWAGYIEGFTAKYIPTQLKKLAWSFAVRCDAHMELLNGQRERRTPTEILADIKAAWRKNIPLTFMDTDGTEYDVILTGFKGRQPLTPNNKKDVEYIVPIELLEV